MDDEALQVATCDHNSRRERLSRDESQRRRRLFREARDWFDEHGHEYTDQAQCAHDCKCAIIGTLGLIIVEAIISELVQIWVAHWFHAKDGMRIDDGFLIQGLSGDDPGE